MNNEAGGLHVAIDPSSTDYSTTSDAWRVQRNVMLTAIQQLPDVVSIDRVETPEPGAKGGTGAIIATLANAGAFTALALVIRTWLEADKARGVKVTLRRGAREVSVDISKIDESMLPDLLKQLQDD